MCFNLTFRDLIKGLLPLKTILVSLERRGRLEGGYRFFYSR
jgi:hypothetical protein